MKYLFLVGCIFSVSTVQSQPQLPPRLNIPGALLVTQAKPTPFRTQRIHAPAPHPGFPPRLRGRPSAPAAPIRPVVEEVEDPPPPPSTPSVVDSFDDEVSRLGISVLQSAVGQAVTSEEDVRPVHFRPERPVPLLRQDVPLQRPPSPVLRHHEQRENIPRGGGGALLRQEPKDDLPVRQQQPIRHSQLRQQQQIPVQTQVVRQPTRVRQPSQHLDEDGVRVHSGRTRKPPVQILRKYRNDNPDGSITWGFENEDGTFKEETLGVDCMTRGKYGYIDPDGVRREYSYETGNKCDEPEEKDEDLPIPNRPAAPPQALQPRKPQFRPQHQPI